MPDIQETICVYPDWLERRMAEHKKMLARAEAEFDHESTMAKRHWAQGRWNEQMKDATEIE